MAGNLPTPQKTWICSTILNTLHGSTSEANQADLWVAIKNRRKALGHTVVGSGNNSSGGMDGVDRWTTYADVAGVKHNWIVLQQPGTAAQDLIAHDGLGQNNWLFKHSPAGLFTGGASDTYPTASDSSGPLYSGAAGGIFMGNGEEGSNPQYVCHMWISDDLTCCRMSFWIAPLSGGGKGKNFGNIWYDQADDPTPGWTHPNYAMVERTTNTINEPSDAFQQCGRMDYYVYEPPGGSGMFVGRGPHGTMAMYATLEGSTRGSSVGPLVEISTAKNKISNTYRFGEGRAGLYFPISNSDGGFHGRIFDMWWTQYRQITTLFNAGDMVPLDSSKQFAIIGDYMLPWDGTAFNTGGAAGADVGDFDFVADLSQCPAPPVVPPQPTPPPASGPTLSFGAAADPLGAGVITPLIRTEHQDFATASGVPLVMSCIREILGTPIGTLPWEPFFGSNLFRLRHRSQDPTFQDLVRVYSADAIARWEPRAAVTRVEIVPTTNSVGQRNGVDVNIYVMIGNKEFPTRITI